MAPEALTASTTGATVMMATGFARAAQGVLPARQTAAPTAVPATIRRPAPSQEATAATALQAAALHVPSAAVQTHAREAASAEGHVVALMAADHIAQAVHPAVQVAVHAAPAASEAMVAAADKGTLHKRICNIYKLLIDKLLENSSLVCSRRLPFALRKVTFCYVKCYVWCGER